MKCTLIALLLTTCSMVAAAQTAATAPLQQPSNSDEADILAAIDTFFAAVEAKDEARILAAVVPDGLATSVRVDGDVQPRSRNWHWTRYVEFVSAAPRMTERLIAPQIRVERDIARVWGRYEVSEDGAFAHCGVDHFDMVRTRGKWLIYNLTWSTQSAGCTSR